VYACAVVVWGNAHVSQRKRSAFKQADGIGANSPTRNARNTQSETSYTAKYSTGTLLAVVDEYGQDARHGKEGTYSSGGTSDKTLHRLSLGSDKIGKSTNRISHHDINDDDARQWSVELPVRATSADHRCRCVGFGWCAAGNKKEASSTICNLIRSSFSIPLRLALPSHATPP
jgi:hypothetical protein